MGERSPFVSDNRKVPRSLVCTFPRAPSAASLYAAISRITPPEAAASRVALPLNLPESQRNALTSRARRKPEAKRTVLEPDGAQERLMSAPLPLSPSVYRHHSPFTPP